jgi:hypothetical protein
MWWFKYDPKYSRKDFELINAMSKVGKAEDHIEDVLLCLEELGLIKPIPS